MDEHLFRLINEQWTNPALDRLMAAVSSLDFWMPFLLVLGVSAAWFGRRQGRLFLVTLALLLALVEGLVDLPLKHGIHRLRPYQAMAGVREVDLDRHTHPRVLAVFRPLWVITSPQPPPDIASSHEGRSFPSGHTMNNFCAAVALTLFYRRLGWLYFVPATLIAYSRIYVGAHWPSDVLLSMVLSVGVALGILAALRWSYQRVPLPAWVTGVLGRRRAGGLP